MNKPAISAHANPSRIALFVSGAGLAALMLLFLGPNIADVDLWHEMALAREIVAEGRVPWNDDFAYTPTRYPVVHHEWGAGIIAHALATLLGGTGIVLARYALALALCAVTLAIARRRGATWPTLAFVAPLGIALISMGFSPIRAQLYSFLFFALLLGALESDRRGERGWIVPTLLMFLLWINLHAGFLIGLEVLAVHWWEQLLRGRRHAHLAAVGLGVAALVALNPYGVNYYGYLLHASTMPRPLVLEWWPIWKTSDWVRILTFGLSLLVLAYAVRRTGLANARGLSILAVLSLAGALRCRLLEFYAIAWMAYVPGWLGATPLGAIMERVYQRRSRWVMAFWSVLLVVCLVRLVPLRPWNLQVPGSPQPASGTQPYYPVGAVDYLAANHFRGNVMTHFNWGAYVSWKLGPAVKVSLDSRYEVAYPEWLVEENCRFYEGQPGWQSILRAYPTDVVLIPVDFPVARLMPQAAGWRRVYSDRAFLLYARPGLDLPAVDRGNEAFSGTVP